jgi:CheY-like chemotaxis protein
LVADDERIIADTLVLILNQSGYRAIVVYSGEQALQAAAESPPHVLISDVVMGGMNGIEAALAILRICAVPRDSVLRPGCDRQPAGPTCCRTSVRDSG